MEKIYIFGHQKPDTDSVTSAISLSYLKNQLGMNTEPRVLGDLSNETKFVLDYFHVETPKLLDDVKLQLKDLNYHKDYFLNEKTSIKDTYDYMTEKSITGVPLVDDKQKFIGLITVKGIINSLIRGDLDTLETSYDNILSVLEGEEILKFDSEIFGTIMAVAYRSTTILNTIQLKRDDILIVGDRHSIIEYAVESGVKLIILVGNGTIKEEHLEIAKKNHVNIIRTSKSTFHAAKIIGLSNYIRTLNENIRPYTFNEDYYYDDFLTKTSKLKHNNYPIIGKNNICKGLIRITEIAEKNRKKVILVDHNEVEQSVEGLDEAEIIEIVDHHKVGSISTNNPIDFRIMTVGCTNTIIHKLYQENHMEIPKQIAGLMLSGILSDTMALTSPTTTDLDKEVVEDLAKIVGVDYHQYALEMFKAGTSLKGKTEEEIVNTDIKVFQKEDTKFAVSQVFTLNFEEIFEKKENYLEIINQIASDKEYRFVFLIVTDIIKNGSYVLYSEKATELVETIFELEEVPQGYYVDGWVSRKKQIVPVLMELIH